ncbi:hypothetical protein QBC46DRAFT_427659 [Diplogelasinospora grovesii]|uniref:SnoaL-like domain-containing protein n=1 Tax=Diplogelasinospora grovesii TaxID=303347 RepID=A0AAN6RZM8_9PEZI|nr:hypothetical protein QBC46DRAFT_427659 [Diplogelasinospora grovesii]
MADQTQLVDLQRRLQRLEDKDAIISLLHRYCKMADSHQWADYAACFAEDGVVRFEEWDDVVGRDQIAALISSGLGRFRGLQHSLTNIDLAISGDTATGTCYLWFAATLDTAKPHEHQGFGGPYEMTFRRTAEGWKISTLKLRKIWAQNTDSDGPIGG